MAKKVFSPEDQQSSSNTAGNSSSSASLPDPALIAQSQQLYWQFLQEQITSSNLEVPSELRQMRPTSQDATTFSLQSFANLRHLASQFSSSPLREAVRQRATEVDLSTLNSHNFLQLLQEVFCDGQITRERVLVVFFFCSDLTVRALQQRADSCFRSVLQWSNDYITGGMSSWVQLQGGWATILNDSANAALKMSLSVACCFAIVAMAVYIKKNWS